MFCSNCGKELPENTKFCPECGTPVEVKDAAESEVQAAAEKAESEVQAAAEKAESEVQAAAEKAEKEEQSDSDKSGGKKKKKGVAGIIIAAVLVLVLCMGAAVGACFLFAKDRTENFVHATFDKPEKYYAYVFNKNYEANKQMLKVDYLSKIKQQMDILNSSGHEKIKIQLGERGKEYLKLAENYVNLEWLSSFGLDFGADIQMKNKAAAADASIYLNEKKILTGNFLLDLNKGMAAVRVPDVSDKYIGIDFSDSYEVEDVEKYISAFQKIVDAYPDDDFYKKKFDQYAEYYLEKVEEVEKSKDKVEADELSLECTALTVTLKEKDVQDFYKMIIEDVAKDPQVEKLVRAVAELDVTGQEESEIQKASDEGYQKFQKECKDMVSEEQLDKIGIKKVKMTFYVDQNGKIVGTYVKVDPKSEEGQSTEVTSVFLQEGNKFELVYKLTTDKDKLQVKGSGTIKDNLLEGSFLVDVKEGQMLKVTVDELDLEAVKNGNLSGHFKIKGGKDLNWSEILEKSGTDGSAVAGTILAGLDPSLDVIVDMKDGSYSCQIGIQDGGVDIVRFFYEAGLDEAGVITIPEDCIDVDENPEEYLKTVKLDQVIEALKEANVPVEYREYLEEMKKELEEYLEYLEQRK